MSANTMPEELIPQTLLGSWPACMLDRWPRTAPAHTRLAPAVAGAPGSMGLITLAPMQVILCLSPASAQLRPSGASCAAAPPVSQNCRSPGRFRSALSLLSQRRLVPVPGSFSVEDAEQHTPDQFPELAEVSLITSHPPHLRRGSQRMGRPGRRRPRAQSGCLSSPTLWRVVDTRVAPGFCLSL